MTVRAALQGVALLLLCGVLGMRAQSGWAPLLAGGPQENLWSAALAGDRIVAVGERGTIIAYPLSGDVLFGTPSYTDAWLVGVAYGPAGRLVAVGERGTILTSDDGSVTWTARSSPTTTRLNAVAYGGGRWLAVGEQGVVLVSSDGAAWTQAPSQGTGFLRALVYARGLFIFGGGGGRLYATADGTTFRTLPIATTSDIEALAASPTRLWLVGSNGLWATATEPGSWSISPAATATTFRALAVRSDEEAVAAGDFSAAVYRAGTWRAESPVPPFLATAAVTTESGIFAVGFGSSLGIGIARAPLANDVTVQWTGGGAPVEYGSTVVLTASIFNDSEGGTYQWYQRGVAIPGATGREYTIQRITPDNRSVRIEYRTRNASGQEIVSDHTITVPLQPAGQPELRDPSFSYGLGAIPTVFTPLADGRVLVAGSFSATPGGVPTYGLVRLLASGAVDSSFRAGSGLAPTAAVRALHPLPDGSAYVTGSFSAIGDRPRNGLARVAADGTVDETFRPPAFDPQIYRSRTAPDGSLYVQLGDSSIYLQSGPSVLRLGRDGAPDAAFPRLQRHTLVAVDASGRVLAFDMEARVLRRYGSAGLRDTTYTETPGTVFTDITRWQDDFSTAKATDTGLYVAASSGTRVGTGYTFRKLLPDGGVDPAYSEITASGVGGSYVSFAYRPDGGLWLSSALEPLRKNSLLRSYSPGGVLERDRYADLGSFMPSLVAADGSLYGVAYGNNAQRTIVRVRPLTGAPGRLDNLSVRASLAAAGEPLIAGFVTPGAEGPNALIRAIGPGLTQFGVTDAVRDPRLTLYRGAVTRADNDSWMPLTGIRFASYGAFALDFGSRDAALETTLEPGDFTAVVQAAVGDQGTALVELYRAPDSLLRLINVSARGPVEGERVLIAGFAIGGTVPMRVLVRAAGPALATPPFNVTGTLADPTLTLYRGSQPIWENDNWADAPNADDLRAAITAAGAFPFPPVSRDSAMVLTLAPGAYTAVLRGVAGTSGTALVEVYEVP